MLALVRTVGQDVVKCLGSITRGDDDWELQLYAKRLHGVDAKIAEVVNDRWRRSVVDTVLLGSRALGELHLSEVRCKIDVLHTRYILNVNTNVCCLVETFGEQLTRDAFLVVFCGKATTVFYRNLD